MHSVVIRRTASPCTNSRAYPDDVRPTVVVTASCGIEPTRIVEYIPDTRRTPSPCAPIRRCIALWCNATGTTATSLKGRDVWSGRRQWPPAELVDAVPVAATDPLYVLSTPGTTGKPKGIVRDNGGTRVALLWTMRHITRPGPGRSVLGRFDVGWVGRPLYIVYARRCSGATTVLYEGKPVGTPDPGAFWRVIAEHQVKAHLFTARRPRSG